MEFSPMNIDHQDKQVPVARPRESRLQNGAHHRPHPLHMRRIEAFLDLLRQSMETLQDAVGQRGLRVS